MGICRPLTKPESIAKETGPPCSQSSVFCRTVGCSDVFIRYSMTKGSKAKHVWDILYVIKLNHFSL